MTPLHRRWDTLAPVAIALVGAATLAVTHGRPGATPAAAVPVAGVLARLAGADAGPTLAAALTGVAAALVAMTVAQVRAGWSGRLAGVVAAGWLVASAPARAMAAQLSTAAVATAVLAALVLAVSRIARGGGALAGRAAGVAGATAVLVEPRAWPAVAVGAALILYRVRRGARWGAGAAAAAGLAGVGWLVVAAIGGGPRWAAWRGGAPDLAAIVDGLGPLTLAIAVTGAASLAVGRGERWLAGALAALAVAGVPFAAPLAPGLVVAVAVTAGVAVAELLARAPAPRHQLVVAGSVLALLAGAVAYA
ncbi:MAG: hypothetical protein R3B06_28775 [Kofleriaceae bacterium]